MTRAQWSNAQWLERSRRAVWHPCTQMKVHETLPLVPIARGQGAWLHDFDGRRYLDAVSSWWVNLFGHANPRINAALAEQLADARARDPRRLHAPSVVELSERLAALRAGGTRPRVLRLGRRVGRRNRAQDGVPLLEEPRPAAERPAS